jgi:putative membrane protein
MAFVDFLAFQQVTLLVAAVLVGFVGISAFLAMRRNDLAGVKSALRGGAVPVGSVGMIATTLALWAEVAWPLPGSYNILFTDVYLLFGLTLVMLAVSMAFSLKLQYVGLFALVAGGVTIGYGWNGYIFNMTKEPLETFLLYGAFGLTGILAFPATLVADRYLAHPDGTAFAASSAVAVARRRPSLMGATRAVQPIVPGAAPDTSDATPSVVPAFRVPAYISVTVLVFVAMIALAGIAAVFYLDSTVPAHIHVAP